MTEENSNVQQSVEASKGNSNTNTGGSGDSTSNTKMVPSQDAIRQEIDVKAIADQIKGSLDVSGQIKNTLKGMFAGEAEKKEVNKVHKYFAERPEDFVADIEDMVLEKVEARERHKKEQAKKLAPIVSEYTQKYPGLKNFKNSIEAEAQNLVLSGKSESDALKQALENHAASLEASGIKARSPEDAQRENAMFPPTNSGGSFSSNSQQKSSGDSTVDFIKQQREARQKYRVKAA